MFGKELLTFVLISIWHLVNANDFLWDASYMSKG